MGVHVAVGVGVGVAVGVGVGASFSPASSLISSQPALMNSRRAKDGRKRKVFGKRGRPGKLIMGILFESRVVGA